MNHEMALQTLLADPRFRDAVSRHALQNGPADPVKRVRDAVHAATRQSQFAPHAEAIADVAHQHATKTAQAYRLPGVAGGNDRAVPAAAPRPTLPDSRDAQSATNRRSAGTDAGASRHPILSKARKARDGNHYLPDPNRPGKYLMVVQKNAAPAGNVRDVDFIRHGSTDLNSNDTSVDRIRGHKDVPLNAEGKEQAAKVGDQLAHNPPDTLVASDLCRAKLTAEIISKKTGTPVSWVTPGFRPWDAGELTGQKSSKAVPIMAAYAEHRPDEPLPGGESFHTFIGRFFIALAEAIRRNPNGKIAVVSHHRNERVLHAWRAKGYPADGSIDIKIFNQKGEHTGAAQTIPIPIDRLMAVAQRYQAQAAQTKSDTPASEDRPGQE